MGLGDYIELLRRRWLIVVLTALAAALAAFLSTPAKPPIVERSYRATNTLVINDPNAGGSQQIGTVSFAQLPLFTKTGEVPARTAKFVGFTGPPAVLAGRIQAEIDPSTGTFKISVVDKADKQAVIIADAFADQLVAYLAERQDVVRTQRQSRTQAKLDQLRRQISDKEKAIGAGPDQAVLASERDALARLYSSTYESLQGLSDAANSTLQLTTLERAQPVPIDAGGFKAPASRAARIPIAIVIGTLLGLGLAVLLERLDNKIRDRRRAEQVFGVPVIAEIPSFTRKERDQLIHVRPHVDTRLAEAYRTLRTSVALLFEDAGRQLGTIVVTSSVAAEGKSTIAANLALAFAEGGRRVVLVNADFRRPRLGRDFTPELERVAPRNPFSSLSRLPAEAIVERTAFPRLRLLDLSRYRSVPSGTLVRATMRILHRLDNIDVVVVDTAPLAVTGEALEFASDAQVVLHVARLGETSAAAGRRAAELLQLSAEDATNALVLNDARTGNSLFGHDYYGYRMKSSDASPWTRRASRLRSRRRRDDRFDDPDELGTDEPEELGTDAVASEAPASEAPAPDALAPDELAPDALTPAEFDPTEFEPDELDRDEFERPTASGLTAEVQG